MKYWCMDCLAPRDLNVHGRCSVCDSDSITDNEGRATVDAAALAEMERHLEWLDWAEKVIDEAHRR